MLRKPNLCLGSCRLGWLRCKLAPEWLVVLRSLRRTTYPSPLPQTNEPESLGYLRCWLSLFLSFFLAPQHLADSPS